MIQFIKDIPEMLALVGILILLISLPGIVLCLVFVGMMAKGIQNSRESIAKQKIFIAEQKGDQQGQGRAIQGRLGARWGQA